MSMKSENHTRVCLLKLVVRILCVALRKLSAGSDSDDDVTANVCSSMKRTKHSEKERKSRSHSQASKYYTCYSDSDMGSSSPTRRTKDSVKERKERKIRSHFQRDKIPESECDSDDDAPLAKCNSTRQSPKFSEKERKIRSHSQRDKTIVSEYTSDNSDDDDSLAQTAKVARRKPPVKLRTYDGTTSWETFFAHFQSCAKYNNWTYKDKLSQLEAALIGDAEQVLWDSGQVGSISLSELINLVKARFSGSRLAAKHRAELRSRRRRPGETVFSLHQVFVECLL